MSPHRSRYFQRAVQTRDEFLEGADDVEISHPLRRHTLLRSRVARRSTLTAHETVTEGRRRAFRSVCSVSPRNPPPITQFTCCSLRYSKCATPSFARPRVLRSLPRFVSRVIELNVKRAGRQVDPETASSDSFMTNLRLVLLQFVEPFIDTSYSKARRFSPTL